MSIQQHVLLRHRSEGHLRFDLPLVLCGPDIEARLVDGLRALEGVYRVEVQAKPGKLSIRYLETVCGFAAVVRRLYALIDELMGRPRLAAASSRRPVEVRAVQPPPVAAGGVAAWLADKLQEARETLTAAGIVARSGLRVLNQRPRWLTDFLNDLLMLFLIKLHWHHILTLWLPNPWRYRYEWLATFYLVYLQVQSRLPQRA